MLRIAYIEQLRGRTIVICNSQDEVDALEIKLNNRNIPVIRVDSHTMERGKGNRHLIYIQLNIYFVINIFA